MRNYIIKDVKKNMCYLHKNNIKFYEQKNLPLNFDEKDGKKICSMKQRVCKIIYKKCYYNFFYGIMKKGTIKNKITEVSSTYIKITLSLMPE